MAYKFSRGDRGFGDIKFEDDSDTGLDFEENYIGFDTDGSTSMVLSGSRLGIGTTTPEYRLQVAGNIGVYEFIYHNGDADTLIRFNDDKIVLKAGNLALVTAEKNSSQPHEVTINDGANNVDFVVKGNGSGAGNPGMKFDASTNRLGINGVGSPEVALDIDSDAIRLRNSNTPSSATDFGHQGEIRWDANYIYICIATDTWKRVALSTW